MWHGNLHKEMKTEDTELNTYILKYVLSFENITKRVLSFENVTKLCRLNEGKTYFNKVRIEFCQS